MDIIDTLAQKVSSGTRMLSEQTDKMFEMTELKMDMKQLENEIMEAKLYVGELVYKYSINNEGNMPLREIKAKCKEIYRMENEANKKKSRLNRHRGLKQCSKCNNVVADDENYCYRCGSRVK